MSLSDPTSRVKSNIHGHNGSRLCSAALRAVELDNWPNDDCSGDGDEWFWKSTSVLSDLRQFAQSRWVPPYSMLGCVLARVATTIPPEVVLPPLRVGYASLNYFVALVGSSGATKSGSIVAARDWLITEPNVPTSKPASAEGIAKLYAYVTKPKSGTAYQVGKTWTALAVIPEVESLTVASSRLGNGIMAELRGAWSGERLGFDYATEDKRIVVRDHRYRLAMILGVQTTAAETLFKGSEVGTPQRILWMPAYDHEPPEHEPAPSPRLDLPSWPLGDSGTDVARANLLHLSHDPGSFHVLRVPQSAHQAVRAEARAALMRGLTDDNENGHRLLLQLKTAALLMALHGRRDEITENDWKLADHVVTVSDFLRNETQRIIARNKKTRSTVAAEVKGVMADVADSKREELAVSRVASNIMKQLDKVGKSLSRSELRKTCASSRDRHYFDPALSRLVNERAVKIETSTNVKGQNREVISML